MLFVYLLTVCWGCQPQQTVLKGTVENYQGELLRICPEGEYEHRDTIQVDSAGHFVFIPENDNAGIYEISVKDYSPWVSIFLSEGDQVDVKLILQAEKRLETQFSGDRLKENEYLKAFGKVKNDRKWYAPEMTMLTFKEYKAAIEQMDKELLKMLDLVTDTEVYQQLFIKQHLMFQEQLTAYGWRHTALGSQTEPQEDSDYVAYIQSIDLNDPQECNREVLEQVIGWYLSKKDPTEQKDYLVSYLEELDRLLSNTVIKNEYATQRIMESFRFFSGTSLDAGVARYRALCTNDSMRKQVDAEYQEYLRVYGNLMPGKKAPDFELINEKGETCRLSDLRGKYLYIDVWATWCAPCRDEIPYMAKLQEYFAGNDRIALVSISVDANQKVWRNFLKQERPTWAQYVVDRKNNAFLEKEYRIYGIPHFMLLDPEGCFVTYSFTRPSDPKCAKMIEKYLNRQ